MSSNTSTVPEKPSTPAGRPALRVPPEEMFWKRYSPHGELPVSGVGSLALHAALLLVLATWGWLMLRLGLLDPPDRHLSVNVVAKAGGGGSPEGVGEGPGMGTPQEAATRGEKPQPGTHEPAERRPELKDPSRRPKDVRFEKDAGRAIVQGAVLSPAVGRLEKDVRNLRPRGDQAPGHGRGGTGEGGGEGTGKGPGRGNDSGPGTQGGTLDNRPRELRWIMTFDTRSGEDYVRQLHGLGATLAFPVTPGPDPEYRVVEDLSRRPARLVDRDLSKQKGIRWRDYNRQTVHSVVSVLGLQLPKPPDHFVALMPAGLEEKLYRLEKAYRGLEEDQIYETRFRVRKTGTGYEPYVDSQTPKKK